MAYQSQSSRNLFTSNPSRPLPIRSRGNVHYPQPKRPLPRSPKFKSPQMIFSSKSPPMSLPTNNRPSSPKKLLNGRPLSPRKHTQPPSHSLPLMNKSQSHPAPTKQAPILKPNINKHKDNKHNNHKKGFHSQIYFVDPYANNIFSKSQNKALRTYTPPNINTKYYYNNKHTKAQSHSPMRSSPIKHRLTQSFHIKKLPSQNNNKKLPLKKKNNIRNNNNNNNNNRNNNRNKNRNNNRNRKHIFDDSNFTEADLTFNDEDEKNNEIHWIRGELIGIGAFGKVYKGYDTNTGKICAIKQIPFDPHGNKYNNNNNNRKLRKELIDREACIMRQLKHDNIVQFYGYQTSVKYKTLIILMELVVGITIEQYYSKNGCFTDKLISKYVKQIMCGLQFAHKRKIIHRDIKGKNILISNKGKIKLADFGSAKLTDATLGRNCKFQPSMDFNSTALWTAPEVIIPDNNGYDDKIDIWSVGCVIIEMTTAKQPWSECKFENPFAALYHIGQPNSIPSYPSSLSKLCKDFLKLCLVRDPSKRCSASELLTHKFLDL